MKKTLDITGKTRKSPVKSRVFALLALVETWRDLCGKTCKKCVKKV